MNISIRTTLLHNYASNRLKIKVQSLLLPMPITGDGTHTRLMKLVRMGL